MLRTASIRFVVVSSTVVACSFATSSFAEETTSSATVPRKELRLPDEPANYANPELPAYFAEAGVPSFDTSPASNPLTDHGAELGRVLFYDTRLSSNGTISCATCHVQKHAFADPRPVSVGFGGQSTDRNAMALTDLRYVRAGFFWDEREPTLEQAALAPMYSHVEMGMTPETTLAAIANDDRYANLFKRAFGSSEASEERVARALSQFIRSIVSTNSKYDEGIAQVDDPKEDFPNFTSSENLGKNVFFANCVACHTLGQKDKKAIFAAFRALNNGIDGDATARDGGIADTTFNPTDLGQFKPSSLRNVEYTAPYMHDGRIAALEEVVDHYSDGVKRHPNLSAVTRMNMSEDEKTGLVAFLKTLSDEKLIADPKFADPWTVAVAAEETAAGDIEASEGSLTEAMPEALSLDRKLASGEGLDASEIAVWFDGLDADENGVRSIAELEPLVAIVATTDSADQLREPSVDPEVARRGRRRVGRTESGQAEELPPAADLDGDGTTSDAESRNYIAMRRFFQLGDGNRLEVMLDRQLGNFEIEDQTRAAIRVFVREGKQNVNAVRRASCEKALGELREAIGDEKIEALGAAIVAAVSAGGPLPTDARDASAESARKIASFDRNADGGLDAVEGAALLKQLQTLPGGLGRHAPATPDIYSFAERIMKFDADGSGSLTADELPERMTPYAKGGDANGDGALTLEEANAHFEHVAFRQVCNEGIYIGGAFDDALLFHRERLNEIDLEPFVAEKASAIVAEHETRLRDASATEFAACLAKLRQILQSEAQEPGNVPDQVSN